MKFKLTESVQDTIESLFEQICQMPIEDVLKLNKIKPTDRIANSGPVFILQNGQAIEINKSIGSIIIGKNVHADFLSTAVKRLAKSQNIDLSDNDETIDSLADDYLDRFTSAHNLVRINTGNSWTDNRFYMVLPSFDSHAPTNSQFYSIEDYLTYCYEHGRRDVLVYYGFQSSTYDFGDRSPEDIIKIIRRNYSAGTIYEHVNHKKSKKNAK